ncbi:MAG: hypothetical protein U9P12_07355 [Verrucomicrobiota bacterium]|nr:hypothetical protein [Verrucomicrobiota bacterium]
MPAGKDGREILAKIARVDLRAGKVTVFFEADQAYIKEWMAAQAFLSSSKFRVSIEKKKGKTGDSKYQTKRPKPPCSYDIKLNNRSVDLIDGMHIEY